MESRVWSTALLALGLGAAVSGCRSSTSSFECSSAEDCGGDGRCEPTGFCSFPDPGCASGFRYSDFAESLSNQCVMVDAGSTGVTTAPDTSSSSTTSSTAGTSTPVTTVTSSGSEDTSGSTGATTGTTGTTGSSSDSSSETTDGPSNCMLEDFDELPGLPIWFAFSDTPVPVVVDGGELVLEVQSPETTATAGLRTNVPADFSLGGARAVLTEVPSLSVATTAFALNDEVFKNQNGRTFGVRDGMIRLEQTVDGVETLLANEPIGVDGLPLEFAFVLNGDGGELSFVVTRGDGSEEQLYSEPTPQWLDDAYVSLDAGNPSTNPTDGITRFDLVELCADGFP